MKAFVVTSNQDWGTGEFSRQGTRATPVSAKEETHASTFGHVLARGMACAHRRCAIGRGRDGMQSEASQTGRLGEVVK